MMMEVQLDSPSVEDLKVQIEVLKRRVARERTARNSAELLLEQKSMELFKSNRDLMRLNETLEWRVAERTNSLSSLIQSLHAGILLEDENRNILLTNELFLKQFNINLDPSTLIGVNCSSFLDDVADLFEEPETFKNRVDALQRNREKVVGEIVKMKIGRVFSRDYVPTFVDDAYVGHLWKYRDITESYTAEQRIKDSEEKYRGIIENMELGLLEVDKDHRIIRAYDRFCEMTGYTAEELKGQNAVSLLLPEEYQLTMNKQDVDRASGKPGIYEIQLVKKNGERMWVLISGAPFYDSEGNVEGSIGIHYDITDRKLLEDELRQAREVAEHARTAEKDFLANMSHEIRNPINAIAGLTNLFYDTRLSSDQLELLDNIKYSADILLGLLSDVLDISKIESGKMELNEKDVPLAASVKALVQTYKFRNNKNVKFNVNIDPQIDFDVVADQTILNQVLLNLIGNAAKFTGEGEICTTVSLIEEIGDYVNVGFSIKDTGIGIEEDQLQSIFESFKQGSKQTKLRYGGTGLGLSIVKRLVSMYKGDIQVKSTVGVGSEFSFNMMFKRKIEDQKVSDQKTASEMVPDGINHVLIVEDNKINQQYLIGLLSKWEITYDLANHGGEALELIKTNPYDLILMDIRMPVMDGYETTIRIRSMENNNNQDIPIIALTASALVDEKEKAIAAGMNFHLSKPFLPEQLLNIFDQLTLGELSEGQTTSNHFSFSEELDVQYLESFYLGDLDRAQLMFQIFLSNIDSEIDKLKQLFDSENWSELVTLAHRIKPNFVMVGLGKLTDQMLKIEQAGKEQDSISLRQLVPEFLRDFEATHQLVANELARLSEWLNK
ncbi:MAG: hybrid sensor histidine kinase/response regulator [Rickettsiales bacterium]|nr:hybrid sensor histidine kinase/response regulator [Rickettsiales bacterium]